MSSFQVNDHVGNIGAHVQKFEEAPLRKQSDNIPLNDPAGNVQQFKNTPSSQDNKPIKKRKGKHPPKISETSECRNDVSNICSQKGVTNNFAVLDCLTNDIKVSS